MAAMAATDRTETPSSETPETPLTETPLTDTLRRWALEAGFDRAGVAALQPIERGGAFVRWLGRGDHAGMRWLEQRVAERLEPARLLDGAKSALCVALRYHPLEGEGQGEGEDPAGGDLWPRVARYARGRDYHNLMGKRLRKLARRVREAFPGTGTRWSVDTGPVLERELAARAGLGVQGKNTCLLTRGGSWLLLGELFTTLELVADEPLADLCGRCRLCLDACPTGALPEPFRLDANRCISYWTIEHRGAVPPERRRGIGDWVFGCDVCQEVCPWNRPKNLSREPPAGHPDLRLPRHRAELDLAGLLALGEEGYRERFRGSAMQRAGHDGLRRNAATAMGNRGEPRYVPELARALAADPSPVVRRHAAWALGEIGGAAAREALAAAGGDPDPEVRAEAASALGPSPAAG
jgi:epoxyqueuosine reductase